MSAHAWKRRRNQEAFGRAIRRALWEAISNCPRLPDLFPDLQTQKKLAPPEGEASK